ncbi:MAG: phage Gp37/Gp68 family protein, partial [Alicyclobacillaceae bacterium]|nr:phage Gp37/Gp68 family protein [Alicyclobacillaceae bacterium]
DMTWNPVRGCSKVSEGCRNCYAMHQAHRFSGEGKPYDGLTRTTSHGPEWTGNVKLIHDVLPQPLKWKKPRRVFVNSMSDLFHEALPDEFIDRVFAVMALAEWHTFQILTKRPKRMHEYMKTGSRWEYVLHAANQIRPTPNLSDWPLPNVWLGVSVENQKAADERIPFLLQTPAAVRFLSCEPLLGPVDLSEFKPFGCKPREAIGCPEPAIDWVIIGGESGPRARPMYPEWARSLRDQCQESGVPVFVKQLGSAWAKQTGAKDAKGGDWDEWPEDLRVREWPLRSWRRRYEGKIMTED